MFWDLLLPFLVLQQEETGCKGLGHGRMEVGDGAAGALVHHAELCLAGGKGVQDQYLRYHSSSW